MNIYEPKMMIRQAWVDLVQEIHHPKNSPIAQGRKVMDRNLRRDSIQY